MLMIMQQKVTMIKTNKFLSQDQKWQADTTNTILQAINDPIAEITKLPTNI